MPDEFQPFGDRWVRRADASAEWVEVDEADVPEEVLTFHRTLALRRGLAALGVHPDPDGPPFAVIRKVSEGEEPFTT